MKHSTTMKMNFILLALVILFNFVTTVKCSPFNSRDTSLPDTSYIGKLVNIVKVTLADEECYKEFFQLPIVLKDSLNIDRWTISNVNISIGNEVTLTPSSKIGGYIEGEFKNFYANYDIVNLTINGTIDGTGHSFQLKDQLDLTVFLNVTYHQYWAKGIINKLNIDFNQSTYKFNVICSSLEYLRNECDQISRLLNNSPLNSILGYNLFKQLLTLKLHRKILMKFTPI